MRKRLKALGIILRVENTININSILDAIRHIPLIGKHISERIYGIRVLKILAFIISLIIEFTKAFWKPVLWFGMLFIATQMLGQGYETFTGTIFLTGFLWMLIVSAFFYNIFNITTETKYTVFIMGMDAREYVKARLLYKVAALLLGYVLFGIPTALITGVKWYFAILIPAAGIGVKAASVAIRMLIYSAKQAAGKRMKNGRLITASGNEVVSAVLMIIVALAGIIGSIYIVYNGISRPVEIAFYVAVALNVPGFLIINAFTPGYYRTALFAEQEKNERVEVKKKKAGRKEVRINESGELRSGSKGFRYLNELFFKRHGNVIIGRLIVSVIGVVVIIALCSILLYLEVIKHGVTDESVVRFVISKHPGVFPIIVFLANSGAAICRAMYANCDSSFLMYGFYKTPDALVKMFRLRIGSVIRYNLAPAVILAAFSVFTLFFTGGEDYPLQSLFTVAEIFVFLVLFSVRHLALYYILQPYNSDYLIKSRLYGFLSFLIGTVLLVIIFIPGNAIVMTAVGLIITVPYILVSQSLVRKVGPRTFRVK